MKPADAHRQAAVAHRRAAAAHATDRSLDLRFDLTCQATEATEKTAAGARTADDTRHQPPNDRETHPPQTAAERAADHATDADEQNERGENAAESHRKAAEEHEAAARPQQEDEMADTTERTGEVRQALQRLAEAAWLQADQDDDADSRDETDRDIATVARALDVEDALGEAETETGKVEQATFGGLRDAVRELQRNLSEHDVKALPVFCGHVDDEFVQASSNASVQWDSRQNRWVLVVWFGDFRLDGKSADVTDLKSTADLA